MNSGFRVGDLLQRASDLFPGRRVIWEKGSMTYREMRDRVHRLAGSLTGLGVHKGSVIAVADWNSREFAEMFFAAALTGAVVYPINIRLPPELAIRTIKESGAEWFEVSKDFVPFAAGAGASRDRTITIGDGDGLTHESLVKSGKPLQAGTEVSGKDPYSILFTSGTTGPPKGILYTQEKVVSGAMGIVHQLGLFNTPATLNSNDVIMPLIPFYHLWAWGSLFHATYLGSDYVLGGRFDPQKTVDMIDRHGVTWINGIPTMIQEIMRVDTSGRLKGLKAIVGGSAITTALAGAMHDRGIAFSTIYGGSDMLATSISLLRDGSAEAADEIRSITHPVPFSMISVRDENGNEKPRGEMGELWVGAPWLPDGYMNDPKRSGESYVKGWFRTGDIARITDSGGIQIMDRLKDVVKSGGEWIPTSILESFISEIPSVESVAVVGKLDSKWGERPVAMIKQRAGSSLEAAEVVAHLSGCAEKGRIVKWWIPEEIIFIPEMPLTSVGKIDKKMLREKFLK